MKGLLQVFATAAALTLTGLPAQADAIYELQVDGLACPFCSYGIEKELLSLPGVADAETDLGRGAVVVTMKPGEEMDEATAAEATDRAGFTLNGFAPRSDARTAEDD